MTVTLRKTKRTLPTDKYGFKSLFSTSSFDPTKPYVTQLNPKAVPYVQNYIKNYGKELERMKFGVNHILICMMAF